ncbi:M16 family metallopeptidase [Haliangium ochraceum]|uniref:Peptidase M16 domain protein n=1 Tax=Haliangium ochraceum (strain DSM 14365 / JCM 11303 / SMP-2) TaxID=502025 RepID=D0LSZ4_HALO1|nr:pitrilysin family protein [Haliangium ochraceum]ACY19130.1 peptidase M16 domain protein [Haliangium ochraceum DSM 14365]
MKSLSVLALGAALLLPGAALAEDTSPGQDALATMFPFPVHQETLDNGLQVIVVPMESDELVAVRMAVRTGARDEYEPGRTGFAHFFEHMMFRGTEKYPAEVYNKLITQMGADTNAYTSDDVTVYQLNVVADDLAQVMELESDRFKNLSYPPQAFETEAGAVYGEYRKNRTSPFFTLYEAMRKAAYTVHTYGHTAMGYEADIKNMPKMFDYSRTFFSRYYRPDNAILVVAGDVEPQATIAMARKYYGDWERGYVKPKVKPEPEQKQERRIEVSYEGRSLPLVAIAYKSDAYSPSDRIYAASHVLASLAFGETSDIYRQLIIEQQAVQFLEAEASDSRDPGLWGIWTMVKDPSKVDEVIGQIDETVARFRNEAPDAERLEAVKSNLRYSLLMELDSPAAVAGTVAHQAGVAGSLENVALFLQTLTEVTPEDVRAAAQKYLAPERRTIAILREKN